MTVMVRTASNEPPVKSASFSSVTVSVPDAIRVPATIRLLVTTRFRPASAKEPPDWIAILFTVRSASRTGYTDRLPGITIESYSVGARSRSQFSRADQTVLLAPVQVIVAPWTTSTKRQFQLPSLFMLFTAVTSAPALASLSLTSARSTA